MPLKLAEKREKSNKASINCEGCGIKKCREKFVKGYVTPNMATPLGICFDASSGNAATVKVTPPS